MGTWISMRRKSGRHAETGSWTVRAGAVLVILAALVVAYYAVTVLRDLSSMGAAGELLRIRGGPARH